MSKYNNQNCPVCGGQFTENDDIAVCPICGAPHHRECFLQTGRCAYEDKHGTEEQWQKPEEPEEPKAEPVEPEVERPQGPRQGIPNMPPFMFTQIDPNEDIDGEKAGNIIRFVGINAIRYLNIFRKFFQSGSIFSWNWIAFLFPDYWLFSRKCYKEGVLVSAIRILLQIPIISLNILAGSTDVAVIFNSIHKLPSSDLLVLYTSCFGIIALSILVGMLGDFIYKKKVYSDLKRLKENNTLDGFTLARTGGVNLFAAGISYIAIGTIMSLITEFLL